VAVCERMLTDYGVEYRPDEVIITAGGKQALHNAAFALYGPGDEVITHAPGWPTLVEQVKLAGAAPVIVRTHPEDGFALHAESVLGAVTPRTRGVVINSPCNPTGAIVSEKSLAAITDMAAARGLWIVVDMCYDQLVYDRAPANLPRVLADRLRDRTVLCGSTSKAYAMTGWRCGWMIAAPEVVAAANTLQSHVTSNVSSITQKAAIAALVGPRDSVERMRTEYQERRDHLMHWLAMEPRVRCVRPAGAFYAFVDIADCLSPDGFRTSAEFAQRLLEEKSVVVTAGEAFDAPGFVRISYAAAPSRLEEGVRRLLEFVADHT
jgi:aspartate aminotransferase